MAEYYFLASLLPQLEIGYHPALGFSELKPLLETNLKKEDLKKAKKLLEIIDMENLRAFWAHEPIDPRGNLNVHELEQLSLSHYLPNGKGPQDYLLDYLEKYSTDEERLKHFPQLMRMFLENEIETQEGFLRDYFIFEREWRLILIGFRAKKLGKDIERELQFEDPADPIVAQILAQKDAKNYEPPFEYKELRPLFETYGDSPLELHQALYAFRFERIRDLAEGDHFSIDRILEYMARLILVEKWLELDVQKGIEIVDTIERNVK